MSLDFQDQSSSPTLAAPMESAVHHPILAPTSGSCTAPNYKHSNPNSSSQSDSERDLNAWLALNPPLPFPILRLPTPIILQIFTCLDLPDLDSLRSTGHELLAILATDSVLHKQRLRSVGSTCLKPHFLNRPNRLDLAKTSKIKGLNVEAKILRGSYLHSPTSIRTFENSQKIHRLIICTKLTKALSARPVLCQLTSTNLIDEELKTVSPALAPTIRLLKRERAKDRLAQQMRYVRLTRSHFDGHGHREM
ncbi:hypothetical protein CROQUDRAFT_659809 [Cronartium quercuum f. sp. fusiforme G11]|uniref:F-box domain-containing protein n=1 Tax=Cronartium quercuum f. sp. fusiforme G11 TaxID=708437 RepID=A0A9P6TAG5_9BASI|nr:hypothetical protein CROQUDRAFT_659809 [Cronartium quercuum f. sp. fusiforme G11]